MKKECFSRWVFNPNFSPRCILSRFFSIFSELIASKYLPWTSTCVLFTEWMERAVVCDFVA